MEKFKVIYLARSRPYYQINKVINFVRCYYIWFSIYQSYCYTSSCLHPL